MKVYGPYTRPDGRKHVIHYDEVTGKRRTQSYPRYLMEQHLGRELTPEEQVDHINNDFTDDRIENLQLLTQKQNLDKSRKPAQMIECICPFCKVSFSIPYRTYKQNQIKQGKAGPYCSRQCAGYVHH